MEGYNGSTSYEIQGSPGPGYSTGTAIIAMQELAAKLPPGIGYEWTGLSYEQVQAGSQTTALFSISGVVILFCLAALYESWAIPIAVVLVAPLGVIGAVIATQFRGLDNDVYFQVGLLTTVGLAIKNAILIVEFAKDFYDRGETAARLRAARRPRAAQAHPDDLAGLRLRRVPAGGGRRGRRRRPHRHRNRRGRRHGHRHPVLAIFFVPVFFVVVLKLFRVKPKVTHDDQSQTQRPSLAPPWRRHRSCAN